MVVKDLIQHAKTAYYSAELEQCEGDQKAFFRLMDGLLKRRDCVRLPYHDIRHLLLDEDRGNTRVLPSGHSYIATARGAYG
jgi:hypothetical protein